MGHSTWEGLDQSGVAKLHIGIANILSFIFFYHVSRFLDHGSPDDPGYHKPVKKFHFLFRINLKLILLTSLVLVSYDNLW